MSNQFQEVECCPPFNPSLWENKKFSWENKKFIRDKVFCFFNIPINFGSVMTKLSKIRDGSNANLDEFLCLSEHTSIWNMDVYFATDQDIPGVQNVTLSGNYYCNFYEGNYNNTGLWIKDFVEKLKVLGLEHTRLYMWYTTCPKCAKKFGKNYTVIIANLK